MAEHRPTATIRELERTEIDRILSRNHVGRVAFTVRDRIDIRPVHYVYADGWIYGRTEARGTKYAAVSETAYAWRPVAFEVDEVEGFHRWRSVVVHGGLYLISEDGSPPDRDAREKAITALRRLMPDAFGPRDPFPTRSTLFRIAVQEATGREAVPDASTPG